MDIGSKTGTSVPPAAVLDLFAKPQAMGLGRRTQSAFVAKIESCRPTGCGTNPPRNRRLGYEKKNALVLLPVRFADDSKVWAESGSKQIPPQYPPFTHAVGQKRNRIISFS